MPDSSFVAWILQGAGTYPRDPILLGLYAAGSAGCTAVLVFSLRSERGTGQRFATGVALAVATAIATAVTVSSWLSTLSGATRVHLVAAACEAVAAVAATVLIARPGALRRRGR